MSAAMNDDAPQPVTYPKKKRKPVKAAPPVEHVELPKPDKLEQAAASPYPEGVQVFSYTPNAGGEPILLALNGFEQPDKVWFFDLAQLPRLTQTWKWMDRAKIPKAIQRQAQFLPDSEYFDMLDAWMDAMLAYQKAGPKGAVTSGK